jgi:hypothetical protein
MVLSPVSRFITCFSVGVYTVACLVGRAQQETDDYGGFVEEWETILDNYDIYLSSLQ